MALSENPSDLMLGKGSIYFDILSGGTTRTGEFHLGNCPNFSLSTEDEIKELFSAMSGTSSLLMSTHIKRTITGKLTLNDFSKENLQLATMGTVSTLTQTGSTVTDESVTSSAVQGHWYPTTKRGLSLVSVKAGTAGAETTKTLTTDYLIDATTGRIGIVEGGGISAGNSVLVSYTYASITLPKVIGGASTDIYGFLRFIGDPPSGPKFDVEIWKCQIVPGGEIAFIGDEYAQFDLTIKVLDDTLNHPTEPYFRIIRRS